MSPSRSVLLPVAAVAVPQELAVSHQAVQQSPAFPAVLRLEAGRFVLPQPLEELLLSEHPYHFTPPCRTLRTVKSPVGYSRRRASTIRAARHQSRFSMLSPAARNRFWCPPHRWMSRKAISSGNLSAGSLQSAARHTGSMRGRSWLARYDSRPQTPGVVTHMRQVA